MKPPRVRQPWPMAVATGITGKYTMETGSYLQFVFALALVIGLILGMAYLLRRFGLGNGTTNALGRKKRISTVESVMIDARHKLVLVRRVDAEHLVFIGPGDSFLIERNINSNFKKDSPDNLSF